MSSIFFTSDLHFGHAKVAEHRGLEVHDHDQLIAKNWHKVVKSDDTVYVLGDLSVSKSSEDEALTNLSFLPGKKHLILGNHEQGHPAHTGWVKSQRKYLSVFDTVNVMGSIKIQKKKIIMSHFPYNGEGDRVQADRYPEWRPRDFGMFLLHGHVHTQQRETFSENGSPMMHVGLDAWNMRLVPYSEIQKWVEKNI